MKKLIAFCFIFGSMFGLSDSCLSQKPETEVSDMAGRLVKVPVDPQRVIALGPGSLRQIVYLGRHDRVVGIEQFEKSSALGRPYMLANPDLAKLPTIAPGGGKNTNMEPDLEATLRVRPDVIFVSYMDAAKADSLQNKLGIPVVVLSQGRFAGFDERIFDSLKIAAKVLNVEGRAEAIQKFVDDARKDINSRVGDHQAQTGPSVYVGGVGFRGQQGIESSDADYIPVEWVKANHVVKALGKTEHLFINKEQLLAWNPDVIFIDGSGLAPVLKDYQKNPDYYRSLKAVKGGRTHVLYPFVFYVANIDTAIIDAYATGKVLYPEEFADIDVKAKADDIYRFFIDKPAYELMEKDFGPLISNNVFR